jgi:hypothetical protein
MFAKECKFELTDDQYSKIVEWDKTHDCTLRPKHGMKKYCGAIGGAVSIKFTPTSIGMIITAQCVCGSSLDVTTDF